MDISNNTIGVAGAINIAKSLIFNKSLEFLNLFNNGIGYYGAKEFKETLGKPNC